MSPAAFERAFRIEQLPLAFTLGFSPRPKVSFGLALSVGHESDAEYLDLELAEPVAVEPLARAISAALPEGIEVFDVVALADRAPALQEAVTAVEWIIEVIPRSAQESGVIDASPASWSRRVSTQYWARTPSWWNESAKERRPKRTFVRCFAGLPSSVRVSREH